MTNVPDVSVALLTRNAGSLLRRLLESVAAQETERGVEVVALDSCSTDGTPELLSEFGARVEQLPPEEFNFGTARDRVFSQCRGDVIISLSQDAIPAHPRWLEHLIEPIVADGVAVSCGRSLPDPQRAMRQFPWEANGLFYFTREMRAFFERYGRGLSNANAAYRREVWARLGFGPQRIGEDFKFQQKLTAAGLPMAFPSDAPVFHHHDYSLDALWMRCKLEGEGLRDLGFPYGPLDLVSDLLSPRKYAVWARDFVQGRLRRPADWLFPVLRPCAVYAGNRAQAETSA